MTADALGAGITMSSAIDYMVWQCPHHYRERILITHTVSTYKNNIECKCSCMFPENNSLCNGSSSNSVALFDTQQHCKNVILTTPDPGPIFIKNISPVFLWDSLIFAMGISMLERGHLYITAVPGSQTRLQSVNTIIVYLRVIDKYYPIPFISNVSLVFE